MYVLGTARGHAWNHSEGFKIKINVNRQTSVNGYRVFHLNKVIKKRLQLFKKYEIYTF